MKHPKYCGTVSSFTSVIIHLIIMNRYPYSNGHLLVAPLRHAGDLEDLTEAESADLMRLTRSCVCVLKEVMNPGGFNVGINLGGTAGAGVEEHLHVHIVPRWEGDNNFMAVVADTRVIPEHLKITYDKLLPRFHALNAGGKK